METSRIQVPQSAIVRQARSIHAADAKPTLLWIDLVQESAHSLSLREQLRRFCEIRQPQQSRRQPAGLPPFDTLPDVAVFDYDYPDIDSLNVLRQTRQLYPNIPIIMFTLHHSEDLAIWALRNRVSDYYYKPLEARQINDIGLSLQQWHRSGCKDSSSKTDAFLGNGYPDEVRFRHTTEKLFDEQLIINYIDQHIAQKISEDTLADILKISRFNFSRQFKKTMDMTFQSFLLSRRIEKAKTLLRNQKFQIADVAFAVGFTDPAYFARIFKRVTGVLPSQFK